DHAADAGAGLPHPGRWRRPAMADQPDRRDRALDRGGAHHGHRLRLSEGRPEAYVRPMRVIGLAGWSGAGKTTLVVRLVPELVRRGLTVSTMKHAHHGFDVDQPGKDSYRHREAGATEVLVASERRWALMHETRGAGEPTAAELMGHMTPV